MDKILFEDLKQSLKEAASIRRGELAPGRMTEISAPDAKSIRAKVGLSQAVGEFLAGKHFKQFRH